MAKRKSGSPPAPSAPRVSIDYERRHLVFGWWTIFVFLTLGVALEAMHGFKVGYYLAVDNETRRLMWRLAHAHGGLLGLIHIAFALTARLKSDAIRPFASRALMAATVLLPGGFFLGGLIIFDGDPGLGIILVPIGAALLFLAVLATALGVTRKS